MWRPRNRTVREAERCGAIAVGVALSVEGEIGWEIDEGDPALEEGIGACGILSEDDPPGVSRTNSHDPHLGKRGSDA